MFLVATLALAAFWLLVGPWPAAWVDDRLQLHDPRVVNEALIANSARMIRPDDFQPGPLRAGAARVDILAALRDRIGVEGIHRLSLAGHGKRVFTRSNTGVSDPIFAKALVLDNGRRRLAIVTADLLLLNRTLADGVLAELERTGVELSRDQIYFGATHTHSSVAGFSDRLAEWPCVGLYQKDVAQTIASSLAKAIVQAADQLQPCKIGLASKRLPAGRWVKNRTIFAGPTNDWLDMIAIRRDGDSSLVATTIVFSAHATCRPTDNLGISADYPGILCQHVEDSTDAPCLFLAGAVGGMGPADTGLGRSDWAERLGRALSDEALDMLQSFETFTGRVELACVVSPIELPAPSIKLSSAARASPILSRGILPKRTTLQAVRIGNRVFISTPADYGGELALELRGEVSGLVTVVTSFAGDYIGYVLPDRYYDEPSYESRKGCLYGPRAGQVFQDSIRELRAAVAMPRQSLPDAKPSLSHPMERKQLTAQAD